jgi:microcystin-dependent protein
MATPVFQAPLPKFQFNQNGAPLSGGKLFTYLSGTTTKLKTYTEYTGSTPNTNPIILDSNGQCDIWLIQGNAYTFVLSPPTDSDPPTNPYWTENGITGIGDISATTGGQGLASGVAVLTGEQKAYSGPASAIPPGWLLCTGAPVSRSTYATLFAVIQTAYGAGDGSTTFNLPDKRGRVSAGADNMGGTAANRVTTASIGIAATLGVSGGSELAQTDTLTVADAGHMHGIVTGFDFGFGGYNSFHVPNGGTGGTLNTEPAETGITVTSNLTGNQQNIQPTEFDNWIIWTGPNMTINGPSGPGSAMVAVTPTGSPFAYVAGAQGTLYVTGGTVSQIDFTRASTTINTGIVSGGVRLLQTDTVTITYTGTAPTITWVPG